jgi:hypothetical protein
MIGYIIAAISINLSMHHQTCFGLLCWRWPILIEVILLFPIYSAFYFVPSQHVSVLITSEKRYDSITTEAQVNELLAIGQEDNDGQKATPMKVCLIVSVIFIFFILSLCVS